MQYWIEEGSTKAKPILGPTNDPGHRLAIKLDAEVSVSERAERPNEATAASRHERPDGLLTLLCNCPEY
jgi:hypothetical protein